MYCLTVLKVGSLSSVSWAEVKASAAPFLLEAPRVNFSFCSVNLLSEFFISAIVLLTSRISLWLPLLIYLFLDILYLFRQYSPHFLKFFVFSFSSLSIFKTVDVKSLSMRSKVWAFSGTVSGNFILPVTGPYFPHFFVYLATFC